VLNYRVSAALYIFAPPLL